MYSEYNSYNPYLGYNSYPDYDRYSGYNNYRSSQPEMMNEELLTLNEAIDQIKASVADEKEDEMFYDSLIAKAPNQKAKDIIESIRDDERKHNKILRDLHFKLTGQMLPQDTLTPVINSSKSSYKEDLEKALFGELNAVIRYRRILGAMEDKNNQTLVNSIMTDELRHANKYNFLITTADAK